MTAAIGTCAMCGLIDGVAVRASSELTRHEPPNGIYRCRRVVVCADCAAGTRAHNDALEACKCGAVNPIPMLTAVDALGAVHHEGRDA